MSWIAMSLDWREMFMLSSTPHRRTMPHCVAMVGGLYLYVRRCFYVVRGGKGKRRGGTDEGRDR